jgi:hypothetical protein
MLTFPFGAPVDPPAALKPRQQVQRAESYLRATIEKHWRI